MNIRRRNCSGRRARPFRAVWWPLRPPNVQGCSISSAGGRPFPGGWWAPPPAECAGLFDQLGGGPVVLKAQIHAGGRGKGKFKDSAKDFGGVKFDKSRADVAPITEVRLKPPLVTKQTGAHGQKVSKVLVQEAADIAREVCVGMVVDRGIG